MRNFRNIEFVKWHWNAPNEPLLIPIKKLWTLFWKINKNHLKTHKIFNGSKSFDQISGILQNMPRVVQRSHPYILIRMSQVRCWVTRPLIFWARSKWNFKLFCEYLWENLFGCQVSGIRPESPVFEGVLRSPVWELNNCLFLRF